MYNKISDPYTLKKYKLNSVKGKSILKKYLNIIGGAAKSKKDLGTACFIFGRFQPPHFSHGELIDLLIETSEEMGGKAFLFTSQKSNDFEVPKKFNSYKRSKQESTRKKKSENPIKIIDKLDLLNKLHGYKKNLAIVDMINERFSDKSGKLKSIKTIFHAIGWLTEKGYSKLVLLAGTDRVANYREIFSKYGINGEVLELPRPTGAISGTEVRKIAIETNETEIERLQELFEKLRKPFEILNSYTKKDVIQLRQIYDLYTKVKGIDVCSNNIENILQLIENIKYSNDDENCQANLDIIKDMTIYIKEGMGIE